MTFTHINTEEINAHKIYWFNALLDTLDKLSQAYKRIPVDDELDLLVEEAEIIVRRARLM